MVTITAPEQELWRREEIIYPCRTLVNNISHEADVCWRRLVGAGIGSGYLVGIDIS